jgi:hypothetical protein
MTRVLLLFLVALLLWLGGACLIGVYRFKYPPLVILGLGYLSMAGCFVLLAGLAGPADDHSALYLLLMLVGIVGIFGYRFTYYAKMKAAGITPRRIFGFGAST